MDAGRAGGDAPEGGAIARPSAARPRARAPLPTNAIPTGRYAKDFSPSRAAEEGASAKREMVLADRTRSSGSKPESAAASSLSGAQHSPAALSPAGESPDPRSMLTPRSKRAPRDLLARRARPPSDASRPISPSRIGMPSARPVAPPPQSAAATSASFPVAAPAGGRVRQTAVQPSPSAPRQASASTASGSAVGTTIPPAIPERYFNIFPHLIPGLTPPGWDPKQMLRVRPVAQLPSPEPDVEEMIAEVPDLGMRRPAGRGPARITLRVKYTDETPPRSQPRPSATAAASNSAGVLAARRPRRETAPARIALAPAAGAPRNWELPVQLKRPGGQIQPAATAQQPLQVAHSVPAQRQAVGAVQAVQTPVSASRSARQPAAIPVRPSHSAHPTSAPQPQPLSTPVATYSNSAAGMAPVAAADVLAARRPWRERPSETARSTARAAPTPPAERARPVPPSSRKSGAPRQPKPENAFATTSSDVPQPPTQTQPNTLQSHTNPVENANIVAARSFVDEEMLAVLAAVVPDDDTGSEAGTAPQSPAAPRRDRREVSAGGIADRLQGAATDKMVVDKGLAGERTNGGGVGMDTREVVTDGAKVNASSMAATRDKVVPANPATDRSTAACEKKSNPQHVSRSKPPKSPSKNGKVAAQKGSASKAGRPAAVGSSEGKQPTKKPEEKSVVIDLTLSDSDDDVPAPRKRKVASRLKRKRSKSKKLASSNEDSELLFSNVQEPAQPKKRPAGAGDVPPTFKKYVVNDIPSRAKAASSSRGKDAGDKPEKSSGPAAKSTLPLPNARDNPDDSTRSAGATEKRRPGRSPKQKRADRDGGGGSKNRVPAKRRSEQNGATEAGTDKDREKRKRTGCVVTDKRIERLLNGSPHEEQRARDLAEREARRTEKKQSATMEIPQQTAVGGSSRDPRKRGARAQGAADRPPLRKIIPVPLPEKVDDAVQKQKEAEAQRVWREEKRRENAARNKTQSTRIALRSKSIPDAEQAQLAWRREQEREREERQLKRKSKGGQAVVDNATRVRREHELRQERLADAMMSAVSRTKEKSQEEKLAEVESLKREIAEAEQRKAEAEQREKQEEKRMKKLREKQREAKEKSAEAAARKRREDERLAKLYEAKERAEREKAGATGRRAGPGKVRVRGMNEGMRRVDVEGAPTAGQIEQRKRDLEEREREWRYQTKLRKQQEAANAIDKKRTEERARKERELAERQTQTGGRVGVVEASGSVKSGRNLQDAVEARRTAATQARRKQEAEARGRREFGDASRSGSRRQPDDVEVRWDVQQGGGRREDEERARRKHADLVREDNERRRRREDGERRHFDPRRDERRDVRWDDRRDEHGHDYRREEPGYDHREASRYPAPTPYRSSRGHSHGKRKFEEIKGEGVEAEMRRVKLMKWHCTVCDCQVPLGRDNMEKHSSGRRHQSALTGGMSTVKRGKKKRTGAHGAEDPNSPRSVSPP